ncbi:6-phosphofructokinase [bacterium]|nr:6-phosphofructokinase [bacterium]
MKRIAVLTSGGDAPGMNACVRAVVRAGAYYDLEVWGVYNGYDGLVNDEFEKFDSRSVSYILSQGGTMLYTARSNAFRTVEGRQQAFENCKKHQIDGLVTIGGDGTFTGATIFSEEHNLPVVGVPATIDNDIYGSDYTIGYDTAVNTAIDALDKIRDTATSHNRLFLVEVMGRNAGFIALRSGIGSGAKAILIPEKSFSDGELFSLLRKGINENKKSNIIIVAEGNPNGSPYEIAERIKEKFTQFDIRVSILGHIQRGGKPTAYDRMLASRLGVAAVEALLDGQQGVMVGVKEKKINIVSLKDAIENKPEIDEDLLRVANILSF